MAGPWPIVGRTDELRTALEALHGPDARGGVLFSGVPGAVRTRALQALEEGLDRECHVVVRAFGSRATLSLQKRAQARARPAPRRCGCGGEGRLTRRGQREACGNTWGSGRLVHKHGA